MNKMPNIIIDTREQTPLRFPEGVSVEVGTLDSADYSLKGLETLIGIERKSLDDLTGSFTSGRDRFRREILRLRGYRAKAVVCECTLQDILEGRYRSRMEPQALVASIASWQIREEVPRVDELLAIRDGLRAEQRRIPPENNTTGAVEQVRERWAKRVFSIEH